MVLRSITEKTKNVKVFLDCCHAARMARAPRFGNSAAPKSVLGVQTHDLTEFTSMLKHSEYYQKGLYDEENTPIVCIAAAAATETAWEYRNSSGRWCGIMTEALVRVLSDCRTPYIMAGVSIPHRRTYERPASRPATPVDW